MVLLAVLAGDIYNTIWVHFSDLQPCLPEGGLALELNMGEIEKKDEEAIKALVEYTWKQENIDKIKAEIGNHIDRIAFEVRESVEKRLASEIEKALEMRWDGQLKAEIVAKLATEIREETRRILGEVTKDFEKQIAGEIARSLEKQTPAGRNRIRIYLAIALSLASVGLGVAIAALAGLVG